MTAAEIDALEQETTQLTEERAGLIAAAEKRNGILCLFYTSIDFIYSPSPAFQRSRTRALSRVRSTAKPLALDNESAGVIKAGRRRGYKINREGSVQNTDRGSPPDRR